MLALVASITITLLALPEDGSKRSCPLFSLNVPCTVWNVAPSVKSIFVLAGSRVTTLCCARRRQRKNKKDGERKRD